MRAIAVIAVVLFHAGIVGFSSGYAGVDVFFVVSGYLIGGILLREIGAGEFRFRSFYARRARRILPALLTVVLATMALGLVLLTPAELARLGTAGASAALAISNFFYAQSLSYFQTGGTHDPLLMTWSLGVEEQYYLLVPLLMVALARWAPKRMFAGIALLTLALFLASLWLTATSTTLGFYMLPSRGWELGVGMLLAIAESEGRIRVGGRVVEAMGPAGLLLVLGSFAAFDEHSCFPGAPALLPVLGAAAMIAARTSLANRLLVGSAPLAWIGRRSYSWYLWHWPLLALIGTCTVTRPGRWALLGAIALSFLLAVASERWIERPFRRIRQSEPRTLAAYALAVVVVVAAGVGLRLAHGLPQRLTPEIRRIDALRTSHHCQADLLDGFAELEPDCVSQQGAQPSVAIIGDSYAGMYGTVLAQMARARGWGHRLFSKGLCQPLLGVTVTRPDVLRFAETCTSFNAAVRDRLLGDERVKVVILAGAWAFVDKPGGIRFESLTSETDASQRELLERGLRNEAAAFVARGKRVLILQRAPGWPPHFERYWLRNALPARRFFGDLLAGDRARPLEPLVIDPIFDNLIAKVAEEAGATMLPVRNRFCRAGCPVERDGHLMFRDLGHLSDAGAEIVLAPFADAIFGADRDAR